MQLLKKDSQKCCVSKSLYVNSLAKASVTTTTTTVTTTLLTLLYFFLDLFLFYVELSVLDSLVKFCELDISGLFSGGLILEVVLLSLLGIIGILQYSILSGP